MARMRSPNFPTVPLRQAIDLVELIYKADRENAIDKEVAALHMGYSGLTGRTLKLMGAMSQFGLLDKVGKGQVRVSKTAVSIVRAMDEDERRSAITKAGQSPTLFRQIKSAFEADPSDKTLEAFLMRQGFTDSAVPAVIKAYRDTNSFLAREGAPESYGSDPEKGTESDLESESEDTEDMSEVVEDRRADDARQRHARESLVQREWDDSGRHLVYIFDGKSIRLTGRTVSPAEAKAFVEELTAVCELFAKLVPEPESADAE